MSDRLLSRRLLDQLAYDYLNTHGFVEAANSLKNESQILSPKPLQQIITTTSEESSTQNRLNKVHKSISNSSSKNSSIKIKNVQKIRNLYLNYKTNLAKTNNNFGHSENNNNNNEESDSPKSVIRQAVLTGDLTKAQKEISRANIQFFDSNNQILFEIRYQELIEAIKNKDLKMALKLSNSNLKHLIDPESTDGILGLMADEKDIKTIKSKSEKDPLEENSQSITTDNLTKTNRLNQVQRALSLMISNNKYNKELLDNSRRLYIWSEINRASLKDID